MLLNYLGALYSFKTAGASGNRPKRVYIERDGQILVFAKPSHAAEFIAAEKATVAPSVIEPKVRKLRTQKLKPSVPETVIQIDVLEILAQKYTLGNASALLANHDYEALLALHIHAMIMQDEEDIELLLLGA